MPALATSVSVLNDSKNEESCVGIFLSSILSSKSTSRLTFIEFVQFIGLLNSVNTSSTR